MRSIEKEETDVEACVGSLISKMVNYGLCSETSDGNIIVHQVVWNAFRVHHQALGPTSKSLYLKKAVEVLCSMATKNFIVKGSYQNMLKLRPHLQSVLQNVVRQIEKSSKKKLFGDAVQVLLYDALLSHLYDVTATIMSSESSLQNGKCGEFFKKALGCLKKEWGQLEWNKCDANSTLKTFAKDIVRKSRKRVVKTRKFIHGYASKVFYNLNEENLKFLMIAGSNISSFFEEVKHEEKKSLITQVMDECDTKLDQKDLESLKKKCCDIETFFNQHDPTVKAGLITRLQNYGLFLKDKMYCKVFYAERVASILHSWSRAILDADPDILQKDTNSVWRSSLSRHIAAQCKTSCDVSLLCERLACRGKVSILLESSNCVEEARKLCCETLSDDVRRPFLGKYIDQLKQAIKPLSKSEVTHLIYENGILVKLDNFSALSNLRDLVRINTITVLTVGQSVEDCDCNCVALVEMAIKHKDIYSIAPSCLVYGAKYWAARKDINKALNCYGEYFGMSSHSNPKPSFKSYCWAVYNYAKILTPSDSSPYNDEDAIIRCDYILNDTEKIIAKDLTDKIIYVLSKLIEKNCSTPVNLTGDDKDVNNSENRHLQVGLPSKLTLLTLIDKGICLPQELKTMVGNFKAVLTDANEVDSDTNYHVKIYIFSYLLIYGVDTSFADIENAIRGCEAVLRSSAEANDVDQSKIKAILNQLRSHYCGVVYDNAASVCNNSKSADKEVKEACERCKGVLRDLNLRNASIVDYDFQRICDQLQEIATRRENTSHCDENVNFEGPYHSSKTKMREFLSENHQECDIEVLLKG